jgi:4-hydroxy-3-polyprenylbenzoate decarboxylase
MKEQVAEIALIVSDCGREVFLHELGQAAWDALQSLPVKHYSNNDFFSPCASGSARYSAMLVTPCSMGTLARIAHGIADTLIARTADVMLKERRRLVLMPREAPYNLIHLRNMQQIVEAGGVICPASPAFYHHPATLEDAANSLLDRMLQLIDIKTDSPEWEGC